MTAPRDPSESTPAEIRPATQEDAEAVWEIFREVVSAGDTYAFDPSTPRERALDYWLNEAARTYVAERSGTIVGTYVLRPNQPGLGSHIANAAYMVSSRARGLGVGRLMGEHSMSEARRLGYQAMQFNFVVSTNETALALWRSLGFEIVGTVPDAFRHRQRGYVDAYVMYRRLDHG